MASSWIGTHILDCSNIVKTNVEAHKLNGIALCVLTLVHVWSILLPCVIHKWRAQVVPGLFEWPLSERTPPGFKDADAENKIMSLQVDDVFRLVEMTLLLGIVVPLSIRWMQRCWHLGIQVHRFVTVLYFVDIVRRHSHPHSWVLNTPIFVIWILDKFLSMSWRRIQVPDVVRQTISPHYIVLYWNANGNLNSACSSCPPNEVLSVGSNYSMKLYPASWMEPLHPFTAFKKRSGGDWWDHLLLKEGTRMNKNANTEKAVDDFENHQKNLPLSSRYTNGAVVRTFRNDRMPTIGNKSEARSHTERITTGNTDSLSALFIWGPFQGQVTNLIPKALLDTGGKEDCNNAENAAGGGGAHRHIFRKKNKSKDVVLIGSGSAINFMIDLMSQLSSAGATELKYASLFQRGLNTKITFLYSTRDIALYDWVIRAMTSLVRSMDDMDIIDNKANIRIVLACTGNYRSKNTNSTLTESNPLGRSPIIADDHPNKNKHNITGHITRPEVNMTDHTTILDISSSSSAVNFGESDTMISRTAASDIEAEQQNLQSIFKLVNKRLDYSREIPDGSIVFCQGSAAFKAAVEAACQEKKKVHLHFDQ